MRKIFAVLLFLVVSLGAAGAQSCAADTSTATSIATGLTTTAFTDSTPVDGATYGYIVTAVDPWGFSCSNQLLNIGIPATGTHTVSLTWTASTTPGVTYSVFRGAPPASAAGLAATVN